MPDPVVLIHGLGCDSRFWRPQIAHLEAQHWLLWAPDLPYHGLHAPAVAPTLFGLAGWLAEGLQGLPAILIGHSMGGMIALQIAKEAPSLVRGLVLVDAFPDLALNQQYLPELWAEETSPALREWIERERARVIADMPPGVYETLWHSLERFHAPPWLRQIGCPVLAIYGGRERYRRGEAAVLALQLHLHRLQGPTRVMIIPGAGHFVQLEAPAETNAAITAWMKEHFVVPIRL